MENTIILQSVITCLVCGHRETETMPVDACQFFMNVRIAIQGFGQRMEIVAFFCSYDTVKCPPKQDNKSCC